MSRLPFELLLALRYLRPKRTFVSVITLISVLGVTLGVAVLIIVISVMTGFDQQLRETILGFNTHIKVKGVDNRLIEDYPRLASMISSNKHVKAVAPLAVGRVLVETQPRDGQSQVDAPFVRGLVPDLETNISVLPSSIVRGVFDISNRGLLIGTAFASHMNLHVGDVVTIYSPEELKKMRDNQGKEGEKVVIPDDYEIRGIFDVGYYEYNLSVIMADLPDFQEMYMLGNSVHGAMVIIDDPYKAYIVARELSRSLGLQYEVTTWMEENENLLSALVVEKNVMFYLLFFIMIVAGLCILSALITFVVQKTREIGMLKALGATDIQVAGLFLSQSGFVGVVGVSLGFGLGMLALAYRNEFLHFMNRTMGFELFPSDIYGFQELPAIIDPKDILLICGSALLVCLLGGVIPAWRAGRLQPLEALRYE